MIDLMRAEPNAIKAGFGNTIFYYGVEPHGLSKLASRSEFTLVYSPSHENGWEAVHYLVLQSNKTYFVVDRRELSGEEKQHFEYLLENTPPKQVDSDSDQFPFSTFSQCWIGWLISCASMLQCLVASVQSVTDSVLHNPICFIAV